MNLHDDYENDLLKEKSGIEELLLDNMLIHAPSDLFTNAEIFSQFFSLQMFNSLAEDIKEKINTMLPNFPENNAEQKLVTMEMLFGGENFSFGNPILGFREQVLRGKFQPDSLLVNKYVRNACKRDRSLLQEEYQFKLMHDMLISRKQLLESTSGHPVPVPLAVQKLEAQTFVLGRSVKQRTKRRYLEELQLMNSELEEYNLSSDDESILQDCQTDGTLMQLSSEYKSDQNIPEHQNLPQNVPILNIQSQIPQAAVDLNASQEHRKELKQETHASFFNLLSDLFECSADMRCTLPELESCVSSWQESPISGLNSWYSLSFPHHGWIRLLESALLFLAGQCPDPLPINFSPFVSISNNHYQWEGSGRESQLPFLFDWWWQRIQPLNVNRGVSKVQPSTLHNRLEFQRQEAKRYSNPSKAFRWVMEDYSVCVGPIKSVGVKMKNHPLLKIPRPAYVTVLSLVRDAVSRLPNGEGTRLDILELLKDSQFLVPEPDLNALSSTMSTALDRLQSEGDPCVAFDPNKKLWIYRHRDKSMEELEILAQQVSVSKKKKFKFKPF